MATYFMPPALTWDAAEMSVRATEAFNWLGTQELSRVARPLVRVLNVAVRVRSESGFGVPWNCPCVRLMDGLRAGHMKTTSTVGEVESAEVSVTVQRVWLWLVATACRPGVPPVEQTGESDSIARQSFVESMGELATTSAETPPGPSLVNENVRMVRLASVAESKTRFRNVIEAVGVV